MPRRQRQTFKIAAIKDEALRAAVETYILREQVRAIVPVTEEQVKGAREWVTGAEMRVAGGAGKAASARQALSVVSYKYFTEDPKRLAKFLSYLDTLDNVGSDGEFRCPTCDLVWPTKESLQTHKMWHTRDNSPRACPACGQITKAPMVHLKGSKDDVHTQYRAEHPEIETNNKEE